MLTENKIVHGLWIGKHLSPVELLCVKSFMANGHEFHLWAYDVIETVLPEGVIIEDAKEIIPAEKIFCYKNSNQFGHGKGSYAGFSDVFRYKLLYEKGGWWVDMDVICLKPLDFPDEYVFRTHHDFPVVGNVMKCPKGSALMLACYNEAIQKVNADNTDWNLPIRLLNEQIIKFGLQNSIRDFTNKDSFFFLQKLFGFRFKLPEHWYAIHLVNEEWRRNKIHKEAIPSKSCFGKLMLQYGIQNKSQYKLILLNYLRVYFPLYMMKTFIKTYFWKIVRLIKKEKKQQSVVNVDID